MSNANGLQLVVPDEPLSVESPRCVNLPNEERRVPMDHIVMELIQISSMFLDLVIGVVGVET
jgi:hypothetical protein